MSAHTPGPWKVVHHPRVARVESMRSVGYTANGMASIAWLTGGAVAQDANAHLIAAAPDLLEALEVLADMASGLDVTFSSPAEESTAEEALGRARAAIARARGGK